MKRTLMMPVAMLILLPGLGHGQAKREEPKPIPRKLVEVEGGEPFKAGERAFLRFKAESNLYISFDYSSYLELIKFIKAADRRRRA